MCWLCGWLFCPPLRLDRVHTRLNRTAFANGSIAPHKVECAWLHLFQNILEARAEVARCIVPYDHERPHQALNYRTPRQVFPNANPAA